MTDNLEFLARTLFDEARVALFLLDSGSERFLEANPAAQRLSGFNLEQLRLLTVGQLFGAETADLLLQLRRTFAAPGPCPSLDGFWLRTRDGDAGIPVNLSVSPCDPRRKLVLITARDMRERRQTESQLKQTQEELQHVLATVSDCLWSAEVDASGRRVYRYISPVVEAITGRTPQDFQSGRVHWLDVVHPDDRPRLEKLVAHNRQQRVARFEGEYRIIRADGAIRWLRDSVSVTRAEDKNIRLSGVLTDISERKVTEEALRQSNETLKALVQASPLAIYTRDPQGKVQSWNAAAERLFGWTEAEVLGESVSLAVPDQKDEMLLLRERVLAGETFTALELRRPTKDGTLLDVNVWTAPLRDARGAIRGMIAIVEDISERKRLEEQLRQSQKMEAIGQLAGGIAHDFNNLLTVILGNISLMQAGPADSAPAQDLMKATEYAGWRAAELVKQLLGFSRQTKLRTAPSNLNLVVDEVLSILRRTFDPSIQLQTSLADDLWIVSADPGQMNQVLLNLCLNARDAMSDGGILTLETGNRTRDDDFVRAHREAHTGDFVRLSVRDTGKGISEEIRSRIFEPFFTTKEVGKGTGLGLAVVFGILKQHGGWIECASELGRGSCFDIYLPRLMPTPRATADHTADAMPNAGSETILLVDDEAMIRDVAKMSLERFGYQVLLAEDGFQALDIYRQQKARIDLVVLDLMMPRLSGREVLRRLRDFDPSVRVLLSSGCATDQHLDEQDHILGFIPKPYRADELARQVRLALDSHANGVTE